MRQCKDCNADISHKWHNAKRCDVCKRKHTNKMRKLKKKGERADEDIRIPEKYLVRGLK